MLRSAWVFDPGQVGPPLSLSPVRHKQPFTDAEDRVLADFVRANGPRNWTFVVSSLENRTPKQCRERWHNHLDPSIAKGPWSAAEDQILADKQAALGNKWADIARFLPGRTDALVRNRWNTSVRCRVVIDVAGHVNVLPVAHEKIFGIDGEGATTVWLEATGK
jgi:hypothetical protein